MKFNLELYLMTLQEIKIKKPSTEEVERAMKKAEKLHKIYDKFLADKKMKLRKKEINHYERQKNI